MDTATQRSQAHALIDALPQDSLEIVVALMRKLTSFSTQPVHDEHTSILSEAQAASLSRIRAKPRIVHFFVTNFFPARDTRRDSGSPT